MLSYCQTVIKFPCIEDLASSQTFNVGIQSVYNQTSLRCTKDLALSQGLMLGFFTTVISLPCLKDLVSNQGFNVGNVRYLQSFSCTKDLSAVEGFYVRLM